MIDLFKRKINKHFSILQFCCCWSKVNFRFANYDLNIFYSIKVAIEFVGTPISIHHTVRLKQVLTIKTWKNDTFAKKEFHEYHLFL